MAGSAPFENLPDEIVVQIFSYFSFRELIDTIQNVCVRWKQLAHVPALWLDKEYAVRGRRWWMQGRTCCGVLYLECMHCKCDKTDEKVLQAAGTMPQLRRLTIMRAIKGRILRKICASCPEIRNLQIQSHQKVNCSLMKYIFEKCPKVQKLTLPASILSNRQCAELLSGLPQLSCLVVFEDLENPRPVTLSVLADACPRLQELHFDVLCLDRRDVEDFFKAKKHTLASVTTCWTVSTMEGTRTMEKLSIVPLLKHCTSLRKVRLLTFGLVPEMEAEAFKALGALHSLHEIRTEPMRLGDPRTLSLAFRPGCLTQLRRLELQHACNIQDETVVTISQGCPNLRELRLRRAEAITDAALTEIHQLKHLEILELSWCTKLGGDAMGHIAQLPALHTLILQGLELAKLMPSIRYVVDMKELRCLDLFRCSFNIAVPFGEFPGRLVKLRELCVTYGKGDKRVFAELQQKMPHLKISNTFRYIEEDLSNYIEADDGEGFDGYDIDDDDDDDNDDE